jgi:hypothetical protein
VFVSDWLFVGVEKEIQREGVLVEGKETVIDCGWNGDV